MLTRTLGSSPRDIVHLPCKRDVVEVKHIVIETWRSAFGKAMSRTGRSRLESQDAALTMVSKVFRLR